MAIDFPTSPTPNQLHTAGSRSWSWNNSVGAWYAVNAGVQGIQGIQGTQGTQGLQGITGSQGTQGTQGIQGIQGVQGIQGITGLAFTIAKTYLSVAALNADTAPTAIVAGQFALINTTNVEDAENSRLYIWTGSTYTFVDDLSGSAGIQGITGSQGVQGIQGIQGLQGTAGFVGSNGAQGTQGQQGIQGIQGITGSQGITGAQGITGTNGTQGAQGTVGSTGSQGITGTQGAVGSQGSTGSQGTIGTSVTGAQGTTGASILGTTNTFSGANTFSSTVTAANFKNAYQSLNLDTVKTPGLYHYDGVISGTQPAGGSWYNVKTIEIGDTNRYSQIVMPYSADRIFYRRQNDSAAWGSYVELLHSGNYNNYSPTLTGGSASGTWGINVTGNSATATLAANSTLAGGLAIHSGRNNEVNKVVRTDGNGYIQAGWINSDSGDNGTTAITRITASNDAYLRYYTPANFATAAKLVTQMDGSRDGTNYNSRLTSGFYNSESSPTNSVGQGYAQLIVAKGVDTGWQLAGGYANNTIYTRGWHSSGTFYQWYTLLSDGNYNSYSPTLTGGNASGTWGINVTGSSASCSGNASTASTASALVAGNNYTVNRLTPRASGISLGSGNSAQIEVNNAGSGACNISFHREGAYGAHFGLDTDNVFSTYGWSAGGGYTAMRVGGFAANGTITATGNITAYYSDERLKTKLGNIPNALNKVLSLNGFYFEANETAQALGYTKKKEVGVSAQEVELVLPEIIAPAPIDAQYKTLDYGKLVPLLIEAIKDLNAKVDSLQTQLNNK